MFRKHPFKHIQWRWQYNSLRQSVPYTNPPNSKLLLRRSVLQRGTDSFKGCPLVPWQGATWNNHIGWSAGPTGKDFPAEEQIGPKESFLYREKWQRFQPLPIVQVSETGDLVRPPSLYSFYNANAVDVPWVPNTAAIVDYRANVGDKQRYHEGWGSADCGS